MTHNTTAVELEKLLAETTPGPWVAARNSAYWEVDPERDGSDESIPYCVADVCPSDPENPDGGLQEANARLIAMSPTLARKVIAAEKLAEVVKTLSLGCYSMDVRDEICLALTAWEQAQ